MAHFQSSRLLSPSGADLHVLTLRPKGAPKAIVHINHGMSEHAQRYERFARALVKNGYVAVAHDHRGHGLTRAPDAVLGRYADTDGFDKVMQDVTAVNTSVRGDFPGVPLVCFGHSMGATIALNFALRHPDLVDGLASWNNGAEGGGLLKFFRFLLGPEKRVKGKSAASWLAIIVTFAAWNKAFKPNRTDFDWLSRDTDEVDKYINDPLCGFLISISLWQDLTGAIGTAADDKNLKALADKLPVHLLGGGADPCTGKGKHMVRLGARLKAAGLSDVTVSVPADTRHECLNEVNRDAITDDFIEWLNARFGGA